MMVVSSKTAIRPDTQTGSGAVSETVTKVEAPLLRFVFVDGVRGFLCLWVVLSHMVWLYFDHGTRWISESGQAFFHFFFNTHDRTAMFFALSGFCLMIPVVKDGDGTIRGGVKGFMARRAARLLPTYYAALALALASTYVSAMTKQHLGIVDTSGVWRDNFQWAGIVSHLFLVHNLWPELINTVYPVTWFMAIEADAYVLFALVWIPIWGWGLKRYGIKTAILLVLGVGAILGLGIYLLPHPFNLAWSLPHYLFLFSLGIVSSVITMSDEPLPTQLRERVNWGMVILAALAIMTVLRLNDPRPSVAQDICWGTVAAACFILCAREYDRKAAKEAATNRKPSLIRRILESRILVGVGLFSYSLYLSHHMLIMRLETFLESRNLSPLIFGMCYWFGGFTLVLIFGWVFYLCFEKPFEGLRIRAGSRVLTKPDKVKA